MWRGTKNMQKRPWHAMHGGHAHSASVSGLFYHDRPVTMPNSWKQGSGCQPLDTVDIAVCQATLTALLQVYCGLGSIAHVTARLALH